MALRKGYTESDKMADVICDEHHLLQMISRFGIPLGVGEQSVAEVCESHGIDTVTFLAVANYMKQGSQITPHYVDRVSIHCLITYLQNAHEYFLNFQLPSIRRKLLDAIDCSAQNEVGMLILRFFDEYQQEIRRHMLQENRLVFSYVQGLLQGRLDEKFDIYSITRSHDNSDRKLQELKNAIIKYYHPLDGKASELLASVLFDIFNCEVDMHAHCEVEDLLFVPAVRILEEQVAEGTLPADESEAPDNGKSESLLSEREKEIVASVVKGMSNKEVAENLFISVNTVQTHRKNIARKLNIHSLSALTIYAIVNKLVSIDDVKM